MEILKIRRFLKHVQQVNFGGLSTAIRNAFIPPARIQFAALPFRNGDEGLEYLLVTSRETGRWIIPKGWPTSDGNPINAVTQEAWEEAGARGEVHPKPIGEYGYRKQLDAGHEIDCRVIVYPLEVKYLAHEYPESEIRAREWVSAEEAAKRVEEPELRSILIDYEPLAVLSLS